MIFYIYEDWTLEIPPRCFYVGKGQDRRLRIKKRNKLHRHVSKHHGLNRVVVLITSDEALAHAHEKALIVEHRTFVRDAAYNGIGCNFTEGGEGTSGFAFTAESKAKMSRKRRGKSLTKDHREAMRKAHVERCNKDPSCLISLHQGSRNAWQYERYRETMSAHRKGECNSRAVLIEADVLSIRADWAKHVKPKRGELKHFCVERGLVLGVTDQMIFHVVKRKSWTHI